jgi:hypothetical protein
VSNCTAQSQDNKVKVDDGNISFSLKYTPLGKIPAVATKKKTLGREKESGREVT